MQYLQQKIRHQGFTDSLKDQKTTLNKQLEERWTHEEIIWRKKSHIQWIKEGKRNYKFFHRSMLQRRHTNHITHLVWDQGMEIQKHADIEHELLTYYRHLLSEPPTNHTQAIESIINHIPKEVTKVKNEAHMHPIT
jgi:hypothetical protein